MGISRLCNDEFVNACSKVNTKNLDLLELGDQEHFLFSKKAREVWGQNFNTYVTLDLWNEPGVTNFDLSIYEPGKFQADIITNFGTSEHVEPESGHLNCWKNMHSWLKEGGLLISEIPESGHWAGHGRFTYNFEFFENFKKIGYEILELKRNWYENQGNLIFSVMRKSNNQDFFNDDSFILSVTIDPKFDINQAPVKNNPKGLKNV